MNIILLASVIISLFTLFYLFLSDSGMRLLEALGLSKDDMNLNDTISKN